MPLMYVSPNQIHILLARRKPFLWEAWISQSRTKSSKESYHLTKLDKRQGEGEEDSKRKMNFLYLPRPRFVALLCA